MLTLIYYAVLVSLLFDINHPSYVHAFKNVITNLQNKGHAVLVTAAGKDTTQNAKNTLIISLKGK